MERPLDASRRLPVAARALRSEQQRGWATDAGIAARASRLASYGRPPAAEPSLSARQRQQPPSKGPTGRSLRRVVPRLLLLRPGQSRDLPWQSRRLSGSCKAPHIGAPPPQTRRVRARTRPRALSHRCLGPERPSRSRVRELTTDPRSWKHWPKQSGPLPGAAHATLATTRTSPHPKSR